MDAHTVAVGARRLTAEHVLVATGGWPNRPDIPGAELGVTSNELFYLESLPRRALIVGGGYIAVEFAGIFHGLGVDVTQIHRGPLFLRGFDDDVRRHLAEQMQGRGIDLRLGTSLTGLAKARSGLGASLSDGSLLETDLGLFATGRHPNSSDLGLEEVGVALAADGSVVVDAFRGRAWLRSTSWHLFFYHVDLILFFMKTRGI